jgi:hypothetical protein
MRECLPLTAVRSRTSGVLSVLGATLALAAFAAVAPQSAHAAFALAPCTGSPIQGEGSSLQKVAQTEFWTTQVFYTSLGCETSLLTVSYTADGSGCGIAAIGGGPGASATCSNFNASEAQPGVRNAVTRFAASDAPLTPTQKADAEAQGTEKAGLLHQLPVAVAAVAIVVHFPDGCKLKSPGTVGGSSQNADTSTGGPNDPVGAPTDDTAAEETLRVHITANEMENIWAGASAQKWGNIVPESQLEGEGGKTAAECAETPVTRIVRLDGSGTTYNFKAYLSLLPGAPAGLWTSSPVVGDNPVWPIKSGEATTPKSVNGSNVCEEPTHICSAANTGGGQLAKAVAANNGSIGYLDLATARKEGFDMTKKSKDHLYWIPEQTINPTRSNEVGANFVEPTSASLSNLNGSGAPTGANCSNADYRGIPTAPESDPTLGDWSNAIATGSNDAVTYPVCALTYDFAFDDDSTVFGNSSEEEARARTVKDYLTAVESETGQQGLTSSDYGTLPPHIIALARAGVVAIDWHKTGGGGGGGGGVVKSEPPVTVTATTTTTTTSNNSSSGGGLVTPISNVFSIAGAKVKGKNIVLSLVIPGAGKVQVKVTAGSLTVASANANVPAGQGTVNLTISRAALAKLAKAKGKKLATAISVTFTPTGGSAAKKTKTLIITQAAVTTKPAKKKTKVKGKNR